MLNVALFSVGSGVNSVVFVTLRAGWRLSSYAFVSGMVVFSLFGDFCVMKVLC